VALRDAVETTSSPDAGISWTSGQLVFSLSKFESARRGLADCTRDGETAWELKVRVNRVIL
jgi:hypothetical protein